MKTAPQNKIEIGQKRDSHGFRFFHDILEYVQSVRITETLEIDRPYATTAFWKPYGHKETHTKFSATERMFI